MKSNNYLEFTDAEILVHVLVFFLEHQAYCTGIMSAYADILD